ncbi:hypothetical protein ymoll0001_13410 [Yersinia mollaretii ATCC 43969]|uniref:Uncharacterized protein n=1 Tax=Yersinia mollaretii (strain ATCC 43969 / DSM 18520 / CIP 103324 / CNY 7263 / WAIP 204) TaxID=349967 RepID=A0ABM9Y705_YERMW|nr:hypothetical protein ymoll0001_13410 [Yersinia mollaretii ATCC 43969]
MKFIWYINDAKNISFNLIKNCKYSLFAFGIPCIFMHDAG